MRKKSAQTGAETAATATASTSTSNPSTTSTSDTLAAAADAPKRRGRRKKSATPDAEGSAAAAGGRDVPPTDKADTEAKGDTRGEAETETEADEGVFDARFQNFVESLFDTIPPEQFRDDYDPAKDPVARAALGMDSPQEPQGYISRLPEPSRFGAVLLPEKSITRPIMVRGLMKLSIERMSHAEEVALRDAAEAEAAREPQPEMVERLLATGTPFEKAAMAACDFDLKLDWGYRCLTDEQRQRLRDSVSLVERQDYVEYLRVYDRLRDYNDRLNRLLSMYKLQAATLETLCLRWLMYRRMDAACAASAASAAPAADAEAHRADGEALLKRVAEQSLAVKKHLSWVKAYVEAAEQYFETCHMRDLEPHIMAKTIYEVMHDDFLVELTNSFPYAWEREADAQYLADKATVKAFQPTYDRVEPDQKLYEDCVVALQNF